MNVFQKFAKSFCVPNRALCFSHAAVDAFKITEIALPQNPRMKFYSLGISYLKCFLEMKALLSEAFIKSFPPKNLCRK